MIELVNNSVLYFQELIAKLPALCKEIQDRDELHADINNTFSKANKPVQNICPYIFTTFSCSRLVTQKLKFSLFLGIIFNVVAFRVLTVAGWT